MLRNAIVAAAVLLSVLPAVASKACGAARGAHVTLFGGVDDPDVLVWDSRGRLVAYSQGSADARAFLLPHAFLNRPGTKAIVVSCYGAAVHPKFSDDAADAVGIFILSGRYRGRYGWVTSLDVHGRGITETDAGW